jgi:Bacterial regulatory helix-turn-helix protein, lysR family
LTQSGHWPGPASEVGRAIAHPPSARNLIFFSAPGYFEAFKTSHEDRHFLVEMHLFVTGNTVRSPRSANVLFPRRKAATVETNQIRYFLALCEEQNFTRAAKRCWVSQPSVSNAIKRLEEELGGDLFHRTKNGAKLSPLGMAIRPYLEQINECAEGVTREAAYTSTANLLSIPARTKFMRKIFYATAIPACAFFIGVLIGHQPYSETSSRSSAKTTVDVAALEATIDIGHLPQQDVSLQVYQ